MTIDDVHAILARGSLDQAQPLTEEDGLALMIVLHSQRITLRSPVLDDRPGITELDAITQRHAAEVVAGLWPDRADRDRTDFRYWYYQFNVRTPWEVKDDVPSEWRARTDRVRGQLSNHPLVASLSD